MTCWPVVAFVIVFIIQVFSIMTSASAGNVKAKRILVAALWNLIWGGIAWYFCQRKMFGHAWLIFFLPILVMLYLIVFVIYSFYVSGAQDLVVRTAGKIEEGINNLQNNGNVFYQSPFASARF